MVQWLKELLMTLRLTDRPVVRRKKEDRRKNHRRWAGPDGAQPRPLRDPRRKKERRKKHRRD